MVLHKITCSDQPETGLLAVLQVASCDNNILLLEESYLAAISQISDVLECTQLANALPKYGVLVITKLKQF